VRSAVRPETFKALRRTCLLLIRCRHARASEAAWAVRTRQLSPVACSQNQGTERVPRVPIAILIAIRFHGCSCEVIDSGRRIFRAALRATRNGKKTALPRRPLTLIPRHAPTNDSCLPVRRIVHLRAAPSYAPLPFGSESN